MDTSEQSEAGKVFLVGAGPGDPGLLTLKAYKVLNRCDVVIYDGLIHSSILSYIPPHSEKIYIGPSRHKWRISQQEVDQLLVKKASQGLKVVRLKGGDPFVFGRGGEEAEILSEAGIEWEIIPGITSGVAAPAYAGIPLTHRDMSSSATFLTGHECVNKSVIEWETIRYANNTIVIYMGVSRIKSIIEQLLKSNYKPSTPIASIESGTTDKQIVRTSTLEQFSAMIDEDPIVAPAIIIIGDVVKLRDKISNHLSISNFDYENIKEELFQIV